MRYTPTALCPMVAALPPHTRSHANSGPAPIEAIKKRTHAASTEESRAVSESGESTAAGAEASPSPWQQGHKTRYKGRPARVLRRHKPQPEPRPWVSNCQVRFISALGGCCWAPEGAGAAGCDCEESRFRFEPRRTHPSAEVHLFLVVLISSPHANEASRPDERKCSN